MKDGTKPYRHLPWDSDFFGVRIARIERPPRTPAEAEDALSWAASENVDCLYLLLDGDDGVGARVAEDARFRMTDVRVTLHHPLSDELRGLKGALPEGVSLATEADVAGLKTIAGKSHTDGRFYYDPNFEREQADAFYSTWIENSCKGFADAVLVAHLDGQPAGYISCHENDDRSGQIGLIAVDSRARGRGFGGTLVRASLLWFAGRGLERAQVVTQGRNPGAMRMYERGGFVTHSVQLWYHRWLGRAEGRAD